MPPGEGCCAPNESSECAKDGAQQASKGREPKNVNGESELKFAVTILEGLNRGSDHGANEEAEEYDRQGIAEPYECRCHSVADSRVDQVDHDVPAIEKHHCNAMEHEYD